MVGGQAFVVADAASASADPREGPFDDPSAGQDDEALGAVAAFHDLDGEVPALSRPGHELAGVSAVGPHPCDVVVDLLQPGDKRPGAVTVLDTGCGHQDDQHQAERIDGEMPLALVHLLARIPPPAADGDGLGSP